jgi:ATP-dependent helicase/nuclease subunit B
MRGHPLSRLMVATLGVLRSDFSGQGVRALLKTGLAGLRDEDAIGRLENLILATDPEGNSWREASGERMEAAAVLERWNEAAVPLVRLQNQLRQGGAPGPALWDYMTEIQAATTLEEWIREERKAGREAQAQIHEQAWKQLVDWLEDLDRLFGATAGEAGRPVKRSVAEWQELLGELSDLVESALAATRARLIPPTLDQVTVGTVERSRLSDCALVFVLGLNLGELPRFWTPDPVLGDEERTALGAEGRGRRRLGPTSRHKRLQEQFLAYMALTRARRKLVLSRPLKMEDGKASEPSPLFTLLADHVPQAPRRQARRGGQGTGDHAALPLRAEEWALRLSMAASDLGTAEQLQTLASLLRAGDPLDHADLTPQVRKRLAAGRRRLVEPPVTGIEPALAREYWRDHHPVAITALERLAACPYQFFARDMLRLQERESADLSAMDLGKLRHGLLEYLFKMLNDGTGVDWGAIDLGQIDRLIEAWLAELAQDRQWAARFRRSSLASVALSGATRDLKFFMRAMRLMGQRSALRQIQAEWQFGMEREFVLATPELSFRLRGTVDRIDEATGAEPPALILIDYKSGQRTLNVSRLAHGLELQLPLYAAALRRSWAAQKSDLFRIGGFFYWPLTLPILDADDTPEVEGDEQAGLEAWLRERPLVGWFEQDLHPLLDNGAGGSGAVAFKFKRNKDGRLREASYAPHWPTGMLTQFIARQEAVVAQLLAEVARGDFAPAPFRLKAQTACDYCELAGLCRRREPRVCQPRELAILTRADLLAQLGDAAEGGGV